MSISCPICKKNITLNKFLTYGKGQIFKCVKCSSQLENNNFTAKASLGFAVSIIAWKNFRNDFSDTEPLVIYFILVLFILIMGYFGTNIKVHKIAQSPRSNGDDDEQE